MKSFFTYFDWDSFWMNVLVSSIFLVIGVLISIKLIPYFTIKLIQKKRKRFIINKTSFLIQEFSDFLETNTFTSPEIKKQSLAIFTSKRDFKTHHFVAIIKYNVLEEITSLYIQQEIFNFFLKISPEDGVKKIETENKKMIDFRNKLEAIIDIYSLDIEENLLSEISELCLKIRVFERKLKYNYSADDLIEKGLMKRPGVFGVKELSEIYKLILDLIKKLLELEFIDVQIDNVK